MAAQFGSVIFRGVTRNLYKDIYFDDTAGNLVRWDSGAGASTTSEQYFIAPEPCVLSDIVLAAATGQTKTQVNVNGVPTGDILRNSLHLASITFRPSVRIPIPAGAKVTLTQLA